MDFVTGKKVKNNKKVIKKYIIMKNYIIYKKYNKSCDYLRLVLFRAPPNILIDFAVFMPD